MSLSPRALTTVGAARRFAFRKSDDDSHDEDLEDSINAFSDTIRAYCRREWRPRTAAPELRRFRYDGSGMLSLSPYDLRGAPTLVTLYSDMPTSQQVALAAGSASVEGAYRLHTPHPLLGTYEWLYLPSTSSVGYAWPSPAALTAAPYEVAVTGNWGIADTLDQLPYDVQRACLIADKDSYVNPEGYERRDLGELNITEAVEPSELFETTAGSLPQSARALLTPYRRSGRRAPLLG